MHGSDGDQRCKRESYSSKDGQLVDSGQRPRLQQKAKDTASTRDLQIPQYDCVQLLIQFTSQRDASTH